MSCDVWCLRCLCGQYRVFFRGENPEKCKFPWIGLSVDNPSATTSTSFLYEFLSFHQATCNYFKKKTVKRCASHAEGRENCRLTCVDTCRDAPTAAPTAVGCKNSEDAFDVAGKGEKKCSFFVREPSRCDRFSEGKVHCRETCGGCGNEICQDRATSFPVEGKETDKTCNFFRKATSRCDRFPEGKQFCKVSCGLCEGGDSPTKSPTKAPTKFPTIAPTKSPTKFPTIAPTKAPTTSPTTLSYSYSYSYSYSFSFSYSMDGWSSKS